ncbi:hypothetical protein B0H10DRAFT_2227186 [Mycena sp. CBHHK59/15]|nr:hypothetical protein B0H10DRAFT_2227186 [Mycena sp. CBHHK59/15]
MEELDTQGFLDFSRSSPGLVAGLRDRDVGDLRNKPEPEGAGFGICSWGIRGLDTDPVRASADPYADAAAFTCAQKWRDIAPTYTQDDVSSESHNASDSGRGPASAKQDNLSRLGIGISLPLLLIPSIALRLSVFPFAPVALASSSMLLLTRLFSQIDPSANRPSVTYELNEGHGKEAARWVPSSILPLNCFAGSRAVQTSPPALVRWQTHADIAELLRPSGTACAAHSGAGDCFERAGLGLAT